MCQFPEVLEVQRYLNRTQPRLPSEGTQFSEAYSPGPVSKGPSSVCAPRSPPRSTGQSPNSSFSVGSFKDSFITFFFFEKYVTF